MFPLKIVIQIICVVLLPYLVPGSQCVVSAQLLRLIGTDEVLNALQLDTDQRDMLKSLHIKFTVKEKKVVLGLTGGKPYSSLSTAQQQALIPDIKSEAGKIWSEAAREVRGVLSKEQFERLEQLRIQAMGAQGLVEGRLNDQIGLTKEESEQLKPLVMEFQQGFLENYKDELEGKSRRDVERIYATKVIETILGAMTPEQQELYRKLVGEPADLPVFQNVQ